VASFPVQEGSKREDGCFGAFDHADKQLPLRCQSFQMLMILSPYLQSQGSLWRGPITIGGQSFTIDYNIGSFLSCLSQL
jgi:hypothetical protein